MHIEQSFSRKRSGEQSGLEWGEWHHAQFTGQPWKNTTTRVPGPSTEDIGETERIERFGGGVSGILFEQ
jgi:hypothetical protein